MDRPEIYKTPYGNLNYDDRFSLYEGDLIIDGTTIYCNVELPENGVKGTDEANGADGAVWAFFQQVIDNLDSYDQKCRRFAAVELLEGANDWLDSSDDENKPDCYTEEMFISLMELESIIIRPDCGLELGYADGDMFWGHCIMVQMEPDGECTYADIAG